MIVIKKILSLCYEEIKKLANIETIEILESGQTLEIESSVAVTEYAKIYIPTENLIDKSQELAKLQKELDTAQVQLSQANSRLCNQDFISKAPAKVVQGAQEVKQKLEDKIQKLLLSIQKLNNK